MHSSLRTHVRSCLLLVSLLISLMGGLDAASLPSGFTETRVATISGPTTMAFAPDGRAFVCDKDGRVWIIKDGVLLTTPFLDIRSVVDTANERGLGSVCIDPDFATNRWVYVFYTRRGSPAFNRVARYTASGDVAQAGETVIIDLSPLSSAANHNGGGLRFGKDGKLWISVGDNADSANAQTHANLLGKLLRLNKDGSIPSDNPYYSSNSGMNRAIVALGLRNPFTLAVQPGSGVLFVNDVGGSWEEINRYETGSAPVRCNFGWNRTDGKLRSGQTPPADYRDPEHAYTMSKNAICGGDFHPTSGPFPAAYRGRYFFAELNGWIGMMDPGNPAAGHTVFASGVSSPTDVETAPDGSLWYIARGNGQIMRVIYTGGSDPVPTNLAFVQQPSTVNAGAVINPAVRVAIRDAAGNTVTSSSATVNIALAANTGGATLAGTLSVAAVNGIATFNTLSLNNAGTGYTLSASSSGLSGATSSAFSVQAQVTTPVITPDGGSYSGPVWVQIATATSGTTIRYTVDGSTPSASSPIYTAPFQRTGTTTVRAYATRSGFSDSAVAAATITIAGTTAYGMDYRPPVSGIVMPATVGGTLPATLSGTGVFTTASTLTVKPGVVPFTVNSPLWSDNADKKRWVALPGTAKIGFNATGEFTWPGGTVLIKHFEIAKNGGGVRRLETRLLVLDASGGNGYGVTYKWRADGSDADLVAAGGQDEVLSDVPGGQTWRYPSRDQCLQCHTTNAGFVLGPKTRQLNGTYAYPTGRSDNQLRTWNYLQIFTNRIAENTITTLSRTVPLADTAASLETRVRSYLDSNCAGCHRPNGTGAVWDARYDTPLASQGIINGELRDALGISGAKVVVPQDLAKSVLHLRMHSTDPVRQMPPLGRNVVHTAAVDVVAQWIGTLPAGSGLRGEYWTNQLGTFNGTATLTRTDATVNFDWGSGSPHATISANTFSARWSGEIIPAFSETYTFYGAADDGVRLWLGDQLVLNRWSDGTGEVNGTIALTAGVRVPLRLEYFENGGGARVALSWSSPSTPKSIVPTERLYPATGGSDPVFTSVAVTPASATVVTGGNVRFAAEARDAGGAPLSSQPSFTWSVSGGGTIAADGTFTAATVGGPYVVTARATIAGVTRSDTASITVQSGFAARINFQPASAPTVSGWAVDAGLTYGARPGGLTYGWNADVSGGLRDRNLLSDQTRDTLAHLQRSGDAVWEIAVPNGSYQITAVCGDPGYYDSVFHLTAEGTAIVTGTPTSANRFVETPSGGAIIVVNDGRLTLRSGANARNNKLTLVEILQVPSANQ